MQYFNSFTVFDNFILFIFKISSKVILEYKKKRFTATKFTFMKLEFSNYEHKIYYKKIFVTLLFLVLIDPKMNKSETGLFKTRYIE